MRKKIGIIVVLLAILILGVLIYTNVSIETEYTPEKEIEDESYRNSAISLYFQEKEAKNLQVETRLIDSKELLKNPYITLISLLLEGPNNEKFESVIPKGTRLLAVEQEGDTLIVDFSKEFLNYEGPENLANAVYSVVNTVTGLKEISNVKFLIEGKETEQLSSSFARIK